MTGEAGYGLTRDVDVQPLPWNILAHVKIDGKRFIYIRADALRPLVGLPYVPLGDK